MSGRSTWTAVVSCVLLVAFPAAIFADECNAPVPVSVPCTGVLLPTAVAGEALKCMKTCTKECDARVELLRSTLTAEHETTRALLLAEKDRTAGLSKLLDRALDRAPPKEPAFWEKTGFWGVVGFGLGVVFTSGVIYVVGQSK